MTADIRTAAEREAERRWPLKYPDEINLEQRRLNMPTLLARGDFVDGYLAGAARVTPTREQVERALIGRDFIAGADAILALLAGLAEGESSE